MNTNHPIQPSYLVSYYIIICRCCMDYYIIHTYIHTYMQYSIRKKLEGYTEVYIVFIFVYFHVILPYLVTTLLDYILYDTSPAPLYLYMHICIHAQIMSSALYGYEFLKWDTHYSLYSFLLYACIPSGVCRSIVSVCVMRPPQRRSLEQRMIKERRRNRPFCLR